ncbi:unnamed protein product [Leptosia nina]|uniref:Uncharacterized protein n=1 Tax=Leptosia nina TaxID=320188 RepID=A0AAV1J4W7_9NEOP
MQLAVSLIAVCALIKVEGYPSPYYGANVDSYSFGSADRNRGGMVLSRYYNPYYNPRAVGGGMAAFMFKPEQYQPQTSQYYLPDRRRQTPQDINFAPPQQNEVYYQTPEVSGRPTYVPQSPFVPEEPTVTESTEIVDPTEKVETPTTQKTISVPEITEPEVEEIPEPTPKRRVTKKKQVKRPVNEDEEEGDDYPPRIPTGAYFPMFFGYGGRSSQGTPQGATAIANAFSTGRGGVATSHATAYGPPRPEAKL